MNSSSLLLTYKVARRIVVAVVGVTVLLIGVALLVLPGPAFVVIPMGLAILGIEFAWARRWLTRIKEGAHYAFNRKREPRKDDIKQDSDRLS